MQKKTICRRPQITESVLVACVAALCTTTANAQVSETLTPIRSLGGPTSTAYAVTDAGTSVGSADVATDGSTYHAFRATSSGTLTDLGTLGGSSSAAYAESSDGSFVAGTSYLIGDSTQHAFRWSQAGILDLGTLGGNNSYGAGISADGSVVVGYSDIAGNLSDHAFSWTSSGGMADLGTLGGTNSYANAVSANGNVIVGYSDITSNSSQHAFSWTLTSGMTDLGTLGGSFSQANAVDADGGIIVGVANIAGDAAHHAFSWSSGSGMTDLGTLGGTSSYAYGVSSSGSIIVGESQIAGGASHAFRWTSTGGMADLNTLLSNAGVNLTGITLNHAYGISPDGKYIVGAGSFPSSSLEAFVAYYGDGTAGITTPAAQKEATQNLLKHQEAALIQSRSTANELLGFTRTIDQSNYSYVGGMFGSALGYAGGQYSARGLTVLGGIAYGSEDYPDIQQHDATTVALALRYTFNDPFADRSHKLHPFVEVGGWVTPDASLKFDRPYANGAGTAVGSGSANSTDWAEYGRFGLTWNKSESNIFSGYAEIGQEYMAHSAYSEELSASNPFPATVDSGVLAMDIARVGASWTHQLFNLYLGDHLSFPTNMVLASDLAHSFGDRPGLSVNVAGVGSSVATGENNTWGEFGGRIESRLTKRIAVDAEVSGMTGSNGFGPSYHGGLGLTYQF